MLRTSFFVINRTPLVTALQPKKKKADIPAQTIPALIMAIADDIWPLKIKKMHMKILLKAAHISAVSIAHKETITDHSAA